MQTRSSQSVSQLTHPTPPRRDAAGTGGLGRAAPNAYELPWPYIVTLSLPLGGWTVEGAGRLVDSAIDLLRAVGAGEFNRNVALQALRANCPEALLGQHESVYLEVKQSHYDLDTAQIVRIALAQAVARFANAEYGGLLIVGMRGKKVPGGEVISRLVPVAVTGRDVRRYRLTIERRLFPLVEALDVFSVGAPFGEGNLLVVHIPPQPEELKPFLVHGELEERSRAPLSPSCAAEMSIQYRSMPLQSTQCLPPASASAARGTATSRAAQWPFVMG